jgi:hypothetical protein
MAKKIDMRHKEIGGKNRAMSRYYMLLSRVKNTDNSKNANYRGVHVLVGKDEFIEWFMKRDFAGCSVDRINNDGHYELSNMQVIALTQNIAKDKLIASNGTSRCYICMKEKSLDEFVRDKRRLMTGRTTCCKSCDSKRIKNTSPEARARALDRMRAYYRTVTKQRKSSVAKGGSA